MESGMQCVRATSKVQAAARAGRKAVPRVARFPPVVELAMRRASSMWLGERPRRVAMEVMAAEAATSFFAVKEACWTNSAARTSWTRPQEMQNGWGGGVEWDRMGRRRRAGWGGGARAGLGGGAGRDVEAASGEM